MGNTTQDNVFKTLVVYNICGIQGKQNVEYYKQSLLSLFNQTDCDIDIVVASCCSLPQTIESLKNEWPHLPILEISERLPVNITFNKACRYFSEKNGPYSSYVYVDSGVQLTKHYDLNSLITEYERGESAMVSTDSDDDTGEIGWFGQKIGNEGKFKVPLGKAFNLHCQLFGKELFEVYGNLVPDVFAAHCTESTFTFLCAALRSSWTVLKDVVVHHEKSVDGASSGFTNQQIAPWNHFFRDCRNAFSDLMTKEAYEFGFGYEECQSVFIHNARCYDENGYCTEPRLKDWIRQVLFLGKEEFNYEAIASKEY